MEKENDNYEELIFEAPRRSWIEIRMDLLKTLAYNEAFPRCFQDIQVRIETWELNPRINISNGKDLEELTRQFISIYDPSIREDNINTDNLKQSIEIVRKELKRDWVSKLNLRSMNDFFSFFSLYISTVHQGMMRIKLVNHIFLNLPKKVFDQYSKKAFNLKDILKLAKEDPIIQKSLSECIFEIFLDTWWVGFWVKSAYEKVKNEKHTLIPDKKDISIAAEKAFNSYLEDLFWMEIPGIKILDIWDFDEWESNEETEEIPEISWLNFLFLNNQLPN